MVLWWWLWIYILCIGCWAPHGAWLCFDCTINFGKDAWWMFIRPCRFWFVVLTSHSWKTPEWLKGTQSLGAGNTSVINYRTPCKLWNEFDGSFLKTYVSASWGVRSWSRGEWGFVCYFHDDLGVCWVMGMVGFPLLSPALEAVRVTWWESQANP